MGGRPGGPEVRGEEAGEVKGDQDEKQEDSEGLRNEKGKDAWQGKDAWGHHALTALCLWSPDDAAEARA